MLIGKELIRCFKGLYLLVAFAIFLKDVVCVLDGRSELDLNSFDSGRFPSAGEGGHLSDLIRNVMNGMFKLLQRFVGCFLFSHIWNS